MSARESSSEADGRAPAVSVRTLAAFAARAGSLHRRFTPAPSGLQGTEGHQLVYRRRPKGYRTEITLSAQVSGLLIRGRADGYCIRDKRLEEIKTFYGDLQSIPDNQKHLHWAQLKLYGWLYCLQENVGSVLLSLVYFQLKEEQEYRLDIEMSAQELEQECLAMVAKYQTWHQGIRSRLTLLEMELRELVFPFRDFHTSQRQMAEAVYKSAVTRQPLLIEAPTGTGKTLAAIFPAFKAMARLHVDKLFYLTCKNTGKQLALDAINLTTGHDTSLKVLELTAQVNSCLMPETRCDGDSCPYAKDFYDKLDAARIAAYARSILDKTALNDLAAEFEICPYYLSIEMCRWADVIVADVNQFFDGTPLLVRLSQEMDWRPYLLVDECHNLIERGRMMYSASLSRSALLNARKRAPSAVKRTLSRLNTHWLALERDVSHGTSGFDCVDDLPEKFLRAIRDFSDIYQTHRQDGLDPTEASDPLSDFFFQTLRFQSVWDEMNEDYCIALEPESGRTTTLTLKNLIPARLLNKRAATAHSACYFSATLQPPEYYRQMLGLPATTVTQRLPSPFSPGQLKVKVFRRISTRYRDRNASSAEVASVIAEQVQQSPGNALVFVSSYAYLELIAEALRKVIDSDKIQLLLQSQEMSESDRAEFIHAFNQNDNLLGLAVLGGIFSEGIDLPGDALTGVFVASLGLPPTNAANQHLQDFLQTRFQDGFRFTYLYPGLQKVVQATGRVIRRKEDRGYVFLMDDRFAQADVQCLLPEWWEVR